MKNITMDMTSTQKQLTLLFSILALCFSIATFAFAISSKYQAKRDVEIAQAQEEVEEYFKSEEGKEVINRTNLMNALKYSLERNNICDGTVTYKNWAITDTVDEDVVLVRATVEGYEVECFSFVNVNTYEVLTLKVGGNVIFDNMGFYE